MGGRSSRTAPSPVRSESPGGGLEAFEGPAGDVAPGKGEVEQPQRRLRVDALQVVLGPEEPPGLRCALAAGDGAQGIEPPGDGADEAPLAPHVGGHGPEQRRARLMRAVGAPEALDGLVGPPARLEEVVHAPGGVPAREVRVVAPPGAPGHGEDEHLLLPGHEGGGLGEVRGPGAAAHGQALAVRIGELDHPAAASGHPRRRPRGRSGARPGPRRTARAAGPRAAR